MAKMTTQPLSQTLQLPREGEKVGSGLIISLINTGGSAYVYKTWVEALELNRAVKVMSPDADQDIRERFHTEARINSKLTHLNIVQCFNFGQTAGGLPFLEMDYLSGSHMASLLQKGGPLPLPVALAISIGLLEALVYAHTLSYTLYANWFVGIVHRDIKPANITLTDGGIVKLMDFGIARPVDASFHTMAGSVPGTVAYMSPEACCGSDIDFRSDLYQFGLCLYEFLSGRAAFPQTNLTELLEAKASNKFKPLNQITKGIDRRVLPILDLCLQLDPKKRYDSAHTCLVAVRAIYDSLCPASPPHLTVFAHISGKPLPVEKAKLNLVRAAKVTAALAAAGLCFVVGGFAVVKYGNAMTQIAKTAILSALTAADSVPRADTTHTYLPSVDTVKTAVIVPLKPTTKPITRKTIVQKPSVSSPVVTTITPPPIPSDIAEFQIEEGRGAFNAGKFSEALTAFQTGLKMPSQMPRKEAIKICLYWSARCNSELFKSGAIPKTNLQASWRSVASMYPAGTKENAEAQTFLEVSP